MEGSNKNQDAQDSGKVVEQTNVSAEQASLSPVSTAVLPQSPWQVLRALISLQWWRDAGTTSISFAPWCLVPAVFAMLSGSVIQIALAVSMERLRHNPVEITDLILAMGVLLLGGLLGIAFVMLSFGAWLVRLSAYSVALVEAPSIASLGSLPRDVRKSILKAALKDVEPKKIHVAAVLLWVTLYMMPPFIVFAVSVIGKLITMPAVMGTMAVHLPEFVIVGCYVIAIPNFLFLMNYSIVALVVAACAPVKPQKAANLAFSLSMRYFFPLSVVTIFFTALGVGIGAPSDLIQMMTLDSVTSDKEAHLKIFAHLWQSAINILLFPLTFTPICDILRPQLHDDLLKAKSSDDAHKGSEPKTA